MHALLTTTTHQALLLVWLVRFAHWVYDAIVITEHILERLIAALLSSTSSSG
jgi:hypothetical protein